jgi:hypothetical protein
MQSFQRSVRGAMAPDRYKPSLLERAVSTPETSRLTGVVVPTRETWLLRRGGRPCLKSSGSMRRRHRALLDGMPEHERRNTTGPEFGHA